MSRIKRENYKKVWTNGVYDIEGKLYGFWRFKKIKGIIIKSKYPDVYDVGCRVSFPLYHLFWDKIPQFYSQ